MSSSMAITATTATTCDAMHNIATLHGAIGLARSRRHASSFSSATTCSTDDFPALTKEDLPARDSLEFVRKTIAHKRELSNAADGEDLPVLKPEDLPARDSLEFVRKTIAQKRQRRNAALSARLPVVDAADVIGADDDTFGSPLTRMGRRNANRPWDHYAPHKDSLDISRERATSDAVTKRRSLKQRVCTRFQTVVTNTAAALARAKSGCSLDASTSEKCTDVDGRPKIEVLQHTVRKLA
ncbi:hypothetical protein MBLNU13_g03550t1 [Cladosporium sp. NU13]